MFFPYTHLFVGSPHSIASLGPHIVVLDTLTGIVLSSTYENRTGDESVTKSGPVRCLDVNCEGKRLASVGDDKILKIWELVWQDSELHLRLMNRRELPKKATKVKFTKDGETILVSDKFGDVFSYPLDYAPPNPPAQPANSLSSHDSPSNGTLVLGHASPLNHFLLTDDEKYIITADRDEHVRVSRFPKDYVVEVYCLGHLKFVSALHIPPTDPSCLISGGGDPVVKVWDWLSGRLRWEVSVWECVEPFVGVERVGRKSGEGESEGEGGEGEGENGRKKRGRKQDKKGKSKAKSKGKERQQAKIEMKSAFHWEIHLNPRRATTLFAFPFKSDVQPSEVVHFEFGKPILGFCVVHTEDRKDEVGEDKAVIVYVDAQWQFVKGKTNTQPEGVKGNDKEAETEKEKKVRALRLSSGQFIEDLDYRKELLESFNSKVFIPAIPSELRSLDLYDPLTSLPKHSSDPDLSSFALDEARPTPIGAPESSASNYKARADVKAKGKMTRKPRGGGEEDGENRDKMSKKEMGRMKVKMKVLEREKALPEAQAGEREIGVAVMEVEKEVEMKTKGKGKENMVRKRSDDGEEEGVEMKKARVGDEEECMDQS